MHFITYFRWHFALIPTYRVADVHVLLNLMAALNVRFVVLELVGDEHEENVARVSEVVSHAVFPGPSFGSANRAFAGCVATTPPFQDVFLHKHVELWRHGDPVPASFDLLVKLTVERNSYV